MYADNFGVGEVAFFRSAEYQAFVSHLQHQRGYFARRWADQSIWPLALALFAPTRVEHWRTLYEDRVLVHRSASLGRRFSVAGDDWKHSPTEGCWYRHQLEATPVIGTAACKCRQPSEHQRTVELRST